MMRLVMWCAFSLVMVSLVSCGSSVYSFSTSFTAHLTAFGPSTAIGVSSATIHGEGVIVNGTFSGLSGAATGAFLTTGDQDERRSLIIVQQDGTHSGAFERFFMRGDLEDALRSGLYRVHVTTEQNTVGELIGTFEPIGALPHSLDLVDSRVLEEPPPTR